MTESTITQDAMSVAEGMKLALAYMDHMLKWINQANLMLPNNHYDPTALATDFPKIKEAMMTAQTLYERTATMETKLGCARGEISTLKTERDGLSSTLSQPERIHQDVAERERTADGRAVMTQKLVEALEPVEAMRQACIEAVRAEQMYEGSDFPVCNAIVHAIKQIPATLSRSDDGAGEAFQQRVQPWLMACFGEMIAGNREERNHRFLEEALELVQSCGCTASEAHQLVDYVYGRPVGEPAQEVGGVMVTLAALCLANGLDMHRDGETELARIWTKVEAIRAKQAAKPKHSPLPAHPPAAVAGEGDQSLREIARDLLRAMHDGQERVGYRLDLWNALADALSQPAADAAHPPADALREAFDAGFAACCAAVYVRTGQPIPELCDAEFDKAWDIHVANNPLSEASSAGERIKNIRARADAIAHLTVPEDGNYRSNGQYKREWRIARDAARAAFEEIAALQQTGER